MLEFFRIPKTLVNKNPSEFNSTSILNSEAPGSLNPEIQESHWFSSIFYDITLNPHKASIPVFSRIRYSF